MLTSRARHLCRLVTLPSELRSVILRKAGRNTRRVSPLWKDTYGPLDCGLRLDNIGAQDDIHNLLATDPARFHHITALHMSDDTPDINPLPAELIPTFASTFPKLRSLHLHPDSANVTISASDLETLQPLGSRLTSLKVPTVAPLLPAVDAITHLTALRSLAFTSTAADQADAPSAMHALGQLPHLQQLEYGSLSDLENGNAMSAASLLPALRSLDLSDLSILAWLSDWDDASTNTLRTAMPHLSALTISLNFSTQLDIGVATDDPSSNHAVMAALAQRSALRSLTLDLQELSLQHHNLASLSALSQLVELTVTAASDAADTGKLYALMSAMAVQRTLTKLVIGGEGACPELSDAGLGSLSALAGCLQQLDMCARIRAGGSRCFDVLAGMSCLTHLAMLTAVHEIDAPACPEALGQLSVLTALRVLEVVDEAGLVVKATLGWLPSLTNLQQLHLLSADLPDALGTDMWHVVSLQQTLTRLGLCFPASGWMGHALRGVLIQLTRVQHLSLHDSSGSPAEGPHLRECLLPLFPTLRVLECMPAGAEARAALQAAAGRQDCMLRACS
jgi:hypothetical protein